MSVVLLERALEAERASNMELQKKRATQIKPTKQKRPDIPSVVFALTIKYLMVM